MKIVSIIGTRPEIIKMSPLFELLDRYFDHKIIHTGQHYDPNLDQELFKELHLKTPILRLKTGAGDFGRQMALLIQKLYRILLSEAPKYVIVQGDTNSALAGAITASRLKIKVIHI
jgi:UDP-N-acetylglucosamine 2-epimerase